MPAAETFGYTSERLWRRLGWVGLIRLALATAACTVLGYLAARIAGLPLYLGWQGVFAQQPWDLAAWGLVGAAVSLLLGLLVALIIAPPADLRMPAMVAATALLGFSLRGGTMGSVMQAAGGREVFWLLAVELLVLTVLLALIVALWRRIRGMRGAKAGTPGAIGSAGLGSGLVQLLVTAAVLWVLGRNYEKSQALMSVLLAAGIGAWVAHLATGHIWRWAWIIPMVVGIIGYAINGIWATGVETATIPATTLGFAIALPLDYASVGALGVVLGTIVATGEKDEMPQPAVERPKE